MTILFMLTDFFYQPHRKVTYWLLADRCYYNVPEAGVAAIVAAGAGYTDGATVPPADCINAKSRQVYHRAPPNKASWHQARPWVPSDMRLPNRRSVRGSTPFHR